MKCGNCRKKFDQVASRCPHCGHPISAGSGMFQTSTVLISTGSEDLVYRTVDEVPPRLRSRLLKSTNGGNSATILIADRRGRNEIARAIRKLPSPTQRRLRRSVLREAAAVPSWLTPRRRYAIMAVVILACLLLIGVVFTYRW